MRLYLKQSKTTVLGWDNKPTSRPTSYMVTQVFFGIQVILFKDQRFFIKEPTDRQVAFLSALGLDSRVFRDPCCHCSPIIPENMVIKG